MKSPYDVIRRPIITERTSDMMAEKKYVFEVDRSVNKTEIKNAVETIFKVKVVSVNTMNMAGKPKRYGRYSGYRPNWKKAIVTLSPDSKDLEFFESAE